MGFLELDGKCLGGSMETRWGSRWCVCGLDKQLVIFFLTCVSVAHFSSAISLMARWWGLRLCEGQLWGLDQLCCMGWICQSASLSHSIISCNSGLELLGVKRLLGKCLTNTLESVLECTYSLYRWNYGCLVNSFCICKIYSSRNLRRHFLTKTFGVPLNLPRSVEYY